MAGQWSKGKTRLAHHDFVLQRTPLLRPQGRSSGVLRFLWDGNSALLLARSKACQCAEGLTTIRYRDIDRDHHP